MIIRNLFITLLLFMPSVSFADGPSETVWGANGPDETIATFTVRNGGSTVNNCAPFSAPSVGGTCSSAPFRWGVSTAWTLTRISSAVIVGGLTGIEGCHAALRINDVETVSVDWGFEIAAVGDSITKTTFIETSLAGGDYIDVQMLEAETDKCPAESGCACTGMNAMVTFRVWGVKK